MTYRELLEEGESCLIKAGIIEAKIEARVLLEVATGLSLTAYFLREKDRVNQDESSTFFSLIEKREKRLPLSYITGLRCFMGRDFFVNEAVLIPRQDTEVLVEEVIKESPGKKVLDLCTGSGCIAISVMAEGEPESVIATDISEAALEVAKKNLWLLSSEQRERFSLRQGDLFLAVNQKVDLIVSNPPYIETTVIEELEPEVRDFEPRLALDGSEDGLFFYKKIIKEAPDFLEEGGRLFFEIGYHQAEAVSNLLREKGFKEIHVIKDLSGLDRVVKARLS